MNTLYRNVVILLLLIAPFVLAAVKPNVLWVVSEDHGPHLGCYGDDYATTPHIDAFAEKALRYTKASSNAPVCAVARTTFISGMYAPSTGGQHMRDLVPAPSGMQFFPAYLQDSGYYTTNSGKEHYNLVNVRHGWDESSDKAHWFNRPDGKPFFAVFNYRNSHESQIRNENPNPHHDPALAPIPPYHPDTPEVRKDWAQYYDRLTDIDNILQDRLDELEVAGVAEDTIVVFFADHGSGMPRSKRYPGWSGLNVPLIVYVPERFKHLAPSDYLPGAESDRLISFVDLAPSTLSIAGIKPPDYYHGSAFMGAFKKPAPKFSFGFRGRMDERPDFCRTIMDGQFVYIRNYYPTLPHGQIVGFQQMTPTTRVWYQHFKDGLLNDIQSQFWQPHPHEELFDLFSDPHETRNLATDPDYRHELKRLGKALNDQMESIHDLGVFPEPILRQIALEGNSPKDELAPLFEGSPQGESSPFAWIREPDWEQEEWKEALLSTHATKRYWTMRWLLAKGGEFAEVEDSILQALNDEEPIVVVAAAECIGLYTAIVKYRNQSMDTLIELSKYPENNIILAIHAMNALEHIQDLGHKLPFEASQLVSENQTFPSWARNYLPRLAQRFH